MPDHAAIEAQLVDLRNIGTHKVLRMTLHVPQERALAAIEAFGWPTEVAPVPVVVARMAEAERERSAQRQPEQLQPEPQTAEPPSSSPQANDEKKLTREAAILCRAPRFWAFLRETYKRPVGSEEEAADIVRRICGIDSRSEIKPGSPAALKWVDLRARYHAFLRM